VTLVNLYPFFVRYVWKVVPGHTHYEYSVFVLKLGVTEWHQSYVDRRNASLEESYFKCYF
jgi:hypothetical protein